VQKNIEKRKLNKTSRVGRSKASTLAFPSEKYKTFAKKTPMPIGASPMLCTLTRSPIDDEGYIHEIKWDGYRIISFVNGSSVKNAFAKRAGLYDEIPSYRKGFETAGSQNSSGRRSSCIE
jgi:ATP-dependent DNA ligase